MMDLQFNRTLRQHVIQYYDYIWMKNHGVNVMNLFSDLCFRWCLSRWYCYKFCCRFVQI